MGKIRKPCTLLKEHHRHLDPIISTVDEAAASYHLILQTLPIMANDRKIIVAVDLYVVPVASVIKFQVGLIDSSGTTFSGLAWAQTRKVSGSFALSNFVASSLHGLITAAGNSNTCYSMARCDLGGAGGDHER